MVKAIVTIPEIFIKEHSKMKIYIPESFEVKSSEVDEKSNVCVIGDRFFCWEGYDYLIHFEKIDKPNNIHLHIEVQTTDALIGYYEVMKYSTT